MGVAYPELRDAQRHALMRLWGDVEDTVAGLERPLDMTEGERGEVDRIEERLRSLEVLVVFAFPEMRLWHEAFDQRTPRGNVIWIDPSDAPARLFHPSDQTGRPKSPVTRLRSKLNLCRRAHARVHREYRERLEDERKKAAKAKRKAK